MISSKNIFSFFIGFLFCFQISVVSAQSVGTLTVNILLNRDVMQTIQVPDVTISNDNVGVTITTDNTNTVSLRLLNESDGTFDVDSGALTGGIATAANNGNVTFFIKGLSHGTSTLSFSANTDTGTDTVKQRVNVIGIEAMIGIDDEPIGPAPLSLVFTDESEDGDGIEGITFSERTWNFGNDSDTVPDGEINDKVIPVEFNTEGIHIVTLEITADIAGIGPVTDSTSRAVCVFPETEEEEIVIVEGVGSVQGVVLFEGGGEDGETSRLPVALAIVTLVGKERTLTRTTGLRGIYRFKKVPTGIYSIFACKAGVCDTDQADLVISEGDSINQEFVLK